MCLLVCLCVSVCLCGCCCVCLYVCLLLAFLMCDVFDIRLFASVLALLLSVCFFLCDCLFV